MLTSDMSKIPCKGMTIATAHAILTRFVNEFGMGDWPAFVEVEGKEVRLHSIDRGGSSITFCDETQTKSAQNGKRAICP
jgi:hypothetical protein